MLIEENKNCKCICVTEHWKKSKQLKVLNIDKFKLVSSFCREKGYGGTAIYLNKSIKYLRRKKIEDLSLADVFECACVECILTKENIIIISVYRPPRGDVKIFFQKLETLLHTITPENKKMFLVGDFNIELIKLNTSRTQFLSVLTSFDMYPTILENTRITPNSESCVDNIFTNVSKSSILSCVLFTNISDHTAQKIVLNLNVVSKKACYFKRFFGEENKNTFLSWNNSGRMFT